VGDVEIHDCTARMAFEIKALVYALMRHVEMVGFITIKL